MPSPRQPGQGGLVVVDKPAGMSSHDVVAAMRRIARTRKVGHAGTLDPMATGVLVLGVERATRVLGRLALGDKSYTATIRLGESTDSDDATGEVRDRADASGVDEPALHAAVGGLTGDIEQVPSTISAIKVAGERAYRLARAGAEVELAARQVTVSRFAVLGIERGATTVDVAVEVSCSSGTYVRALARDLGAALGVGGHLTALRRTRVGPFGLESARTLEELEKELVVLPLRQAAGELFPRRDLDAAAARIVAHGGWIPALPDSGPGPAAAFAPDGEFLGLLEDRNGRSWPTVMFVGPDGPA
ncbi:MAG TPA: tRNA pseudouridine(55) synthase TruB [Sporichthyaceae bacterium]|jgi:tRNA pseudouridine55 synthase|nr:tRNA pseudouridine(55) synthase TruB [Sporichthyaceae bacterium]